MRAENFVGGEPPEVHRGRRRQRARIGGEKIAAGRQHVAAAAHRRTGRTGRNAAAVERCKQCRALSFGTRSPQRIVGAHGRAGENVQPVFDREVFHITQPGVDPAKRVVGCGRTVDAGLTSQTGSLRRLDDQLCQTFAATAVEAVGLGVFVNQALKLACIAGKPAGNQRRRQVADGDAGDAAFGLRRLTRIADDERINHRQCAGDDFREALGAERDRLARQPFQRAVRPHVHQCIGLGYVLKPQPESDQRVTRRQLRIVIVGPPLRGAPAIRRQRD